jgi:hypothetical protein
MFLSGLFLLLAAEEKNNNHVLGKVKKGRCKHRWCMVHVSIINCTCLIIFDDSIPVGACFSSSVYFIFEAGSYAPSEVESISTDGLDMHQHN